MLGPDPGWEYSGEEDRGKSPALLEFGRGKDKEQTIKGLLDVMPLRKMKPGKGVSDGYGIKAGLSEEVTF